MIHKYMFLAKEFLLVINYIIYTPMEAPDCRHIQCASFITFWKNIRICVILSMYSCASLNQRIKMFF